MHNLLIIGGGGDMVAVTIEAFLACDDDIRLTVVDYNAEKLGRRKCELGNSTRAEFVQADLFDKDRMQHLVQNSDMVLNAAGPYYKTALPVINLCRAFKKNYCDLNDEPDASMDAIHMHKEIKKAGIGVYIGLGASPGLTNIMAKELVEILDEAKGIDTAWCTGDEGPVPYGRAVIAHAIGIFGGHPEADSFKNGKLVKIPSFVLAEKMPFSSPLGKYFVFELAHPEPLTISHYYPQLKQVRNLGGLHPLPQNGLFRGLSQAVAREDLSLNETIDFVQEILVGKIGSLKCWRYAWRGMREQAKMGLCSESEFWTYIWKSFRGKHYDFIGGLCVRAWGKKDGREVKLVRRTTKTGPGTFFNNMAKVTGTPFAALSRMVLDKRMEPEFECGVFSSEAWVDISTFYSYMDRYGAHESELFDPVFEE
jgi:saccharopine dehydrogenase-like NADP-dependent oxidoreductase